MSKIKDLNNLAECLIHLSEGRDKDSMCRVKRNGVELIEHMNRLYARAMYLTRDRSEAEDLVQETYVRAIRATEDLTSTGNLKSWLMTILRNIWLNQLRRKRASRVITLADLDHGIVDVVTEVREDPYEVYASKVAQERVLATIQLLPATFREVLLLREYEELTYQEIAKVVDCPIGTVMSRLTRARSKLRTLLLNRPGERDRHVVVNKLDSFPHR